MMNHRYIDDVINKIYDLVESHFEWDVIYGMILFEFYPNKMTSPCIYLKKDNGFKKIMVLETGLIHDVLTITGDLNKDIDSDETFSKKPDQLLFTINRTTQKYEYHFVYDIASQPTYSSFDEMLYFEYHLMGWIPESDFNKKLLNNALRYHGEKPVD